MATWVEIRTEEFANQGRTLSAPQYTYTVKSTRKSPYHTNVNEVQPGDIIIHIKNRAFACVSRVASKLPSGRIEWIPIPSAKVKVEQLNLLPGDYLNSAKTGVMVPSFGAELICKKDLVTEFPVENLNGLQYSEDLKSYYDTNRTLQPRLTLFYTFSSRHKNRQVGNQIECQQGGYLSEVSHELKDILFRIPGLKAAYNAAEACNDTVGKQGNAEISSAGEGNTLDEETDNVYFEEVFNLLEDQDIKLMKDQLEEKLNIILSGPPGVGKTFIADIIAKELGDHNPERIQFHQSYSYEDFIVGIKPGQVPNYV